jgi:oligopeptidase A
MDNPLLNMTGLPPFPVLRPEHVEPAIDAVLEENRSRVAALLAATDHYTWDSLVAPLETLEDRLNRTWSPVSHMNAVVNTPELRAAYNACLPKLSDYATEMGQNEALYAAFRSIAEHAGFGTLDPVRQRIVSNALRDFRLAGVALDPERRERFRVIQQRLSTLTSKFEENLLDATHAWFRQVTDTAELAGLPESALAAARQAAATRELDGWVFTLEYPSYFAVMSYADHRPLREAIYTAYVTRASDQGPHAGRWDNGPVMEEILALRHELAQLLGFRNYAERSLATKMAPDTGAVLAFLEDLAGRSLAMAREELDELHRYAREHHGLERLESWDITYCSEQLRRHRHQLSQEALRPYFPEPRVLEGLFAVVERLYGVRAELQPGVDTWHPDVRFYRLVDEAGEVRGQFYLDLYARTHKRGGAWMDECIVRRVDAQGRVQIPVAYLTCNFNAPVEGRPALFTHNEVLTLFHEFGHGLHHMLTRIDHASVAGINGVAWDAVELPSQFLENWCWEPEALALISGHHETGAPLPPELIRRLRSARNFQAGMQMVRQLEFGLFDFRLHLEYDPARGARVQEILDEVRAQVAVVAPPAFNRFQHSFSHIFAGGYAAGYYSYKWAEVLASDAFSLFEEEGIFDAETGRRFLRTILERGGTQEPMELFIEFRGREPEIDALLRHNGIAA